VLRAPSSRLVATLAASNGASTVIHVGLPSSDRPQPGGVDAPAGPFTSPHSPSWV
jgi:hypothetical protein